MSASRELAQYLESVAGQYPYGLPMPLCAVIIGSIQGAEELFDAILSKGLRWTKEQVVVVAPERVSAARGSVRFEALIARSERIIFLGDSAALQCGGKSVSESRRASGYLWCGVPACTTLSLQEVVADPKLKKPLWEDLKAIESVPHRRGEAT